MLADWGVKSVKGEKNKESLKKLEALILDYQPDLLVLEDHWAKQSRRSLRIKEVGKLVIAMAADQKLPVSMFSRQEVNEAFFVDGEGTKYDMAELLAKRFLEELGDRLPPKRRAWMSEDSRMDIFSALALALRQRIQTKTSSTGERIGAVD